MSSVNSIYKAMAYQKPEQKINDEKGDSMRLNQKELMHLFVTEMQK